MKNQRGYVSILLSTGDAVSFTSGTGHLVLVEVNAGTSRTYLILFSFYFFCPVLEIVIKFILLLEGKSVESFSKNHYQENILTRFSSNSGGEVHPISLVICNHSRRCINH
jgi:hypothetical protein